MIRQLAAALPLAATAPAMAQTELGPQVGEALPHSLETTDSTGAERSFETMVGESGMALFFVRSVDWCPYCKTQVQSVDAAAGEFEARGLSVVFVSYDVPEKQAAFAPANELDVVLLSDPRSESIDAFGLRNEEHKEGRFAGIPHPAVFIVAPDKTILAKLHESDFATNAKSYRSRPGVEAILAAADEALAASD